MSVLVSIVGLAVLILIHEAGHFFVARAVGMRPRKFYLGFGAPIAKTTRNGVEYGIGSIPLGGYVKIPGMHRPAPGDLRKTIPPPEAQRHAAELDRLDAAIEAGEDERARQLLAQLEPNLGRTRAWQELEGALAEDAYWRQKTWKRIAVIAAGPATNVILAIALFTGVYLTATVRATRVVDSVVAEPARSAGLEAGDRIVAVGGDRVAPDDIPDAIDATQGRPTTLTVVRGGRRVTLGPLRAREDHGRYRIGFQIRGEIGPGESAPAALGDALRLTWLVTADTGKGIARLVTGKGSREISSGIGIVRASSAAWKKGLRNFLSTMGLISLALALLNLLPVLPLDGGHIVMSLAERIRGRPFPQIVYMRFAAIGFTIFALLLYFGLRNDLFGGTG